MTTARKIKEFVSEQYPYRTEMHAHTKPVSGCSEVPPEQLIEIYKNLGYHGIVITNHFFMGDVFSDPSRSKEEKLRWYLAGYEEAKKAGDACGLHVMLGAELRFNENFNDYLLYGVDYEILSDAFDYLEQGLSVYREKGMPKRGVLLQAHPFRSRMELADPSLLDGIETLNMHPGHNSAVGLAIAYAKENKFPITVAGSDFHHINRGHEGVAALRTKVMPEDSFALANLLKQGDYVLELGGEAIVFP
ncbi:MAG: histidinol phosphatase [Clostridia bacterium]|nr:histidinol phosphatase [Clostridia bacterium]